ncbi:NUDIX hydrolase [Virgibacillus soli]|uniref:NUDIX hydrolase n=1 Tax=Paracerasibacillus soli TaxID=480284 RepID=A0ABU5CNK3_9BACI|nr:NUDIX hydrolase [Virgibacillus soli]MDY0407934.1 NUDIX hydrolase [Virgibacillus soli]
MNLKWLEWARRIQALSQAGLTFSKDPFDIERYEELREISADIIATYTELEFEQIQNIFLQESGYPTPKVDVRGVVFQNGEILLVKERNDEKWALPGGFCEVGLSPLENAIKEVEEESGFQVKAVRPLALLDMNIHAHTPQLHHYYKLFIQCEIVGGEATIGMETNDVQFFSKAHLPELSTGRNTMSQIKSMFAFAEDPFKEMMID